MLSTPAHSATFSAVNAAHQCVITILSSPLNISCFPPTPAIFASSDCANVNVTLGRPSSVLASSPKIVVRNRGGSAMSQIRWVIIATGRWKTGLKVRDLDSSISPKSQDGETSSHVTISMYIYQPHAVANVLPLLSNHHHLHVPPNQTHTPSLTS
jgi:hypothetical protein